MPSATPHILLTVELSARPRSPSLEAARTRSSVHEVDELEPIEEAMLRCLVCHVITRRERMSADGYAEDGRGLADPTLPALIGASKPTVVVAVIPVFAGKSGEVAVFELDGSTGGAIRQLDPN